MELQRMLLKKEYIEITNNTEEALLLEFFMKNIPENEWVHYSYKEIVEQAMLGCEQNTVRSKVKKLCDKNILNLRFEQSKKNNKLIYYNIDKQYVTKLINRLGYYPND